MTLKKENTEVSLLQPSIRIDGLPIRGNIVFLHGWPDDASLWDLQVEDLKSSFRCIRLTLPGFEAGAAPSSGIDRLNFAGLVASLAAAITSIIESEKDAHADHPTENDGKVFLVGHDWGAYLSYLLQASHQELISKLVTIDIGPSVGRLSPLQKAFLFSYQGWLITAYGLSHYAATRSLADTMARLCARGLKAPQPAKARAQMGYLYHRLWSAAFKSTRQVTSASTTPAQIPLATLKNYQASCPHMYLYGTSKPFMFHSNRWLKELQSRNDGAVHALKAGHWVMRDQPEETNRLLREWLEV